MKIKMPIEPHLAKYLLVRHPNIKIQKTDFIGMLVYAHLKYEKPNGLDTSIVSLSSEIMIDIPFFKLLRLSLNRKLEHAYMGFNECIHDFFMKDYIGYMDEEVRVNDLEVLLGMKKKKKIDLTRHFMSFFDLSESDFSSESLLRNYRRNRKCSMSN